MNLSSGFFDMTTFFLRARKCFIITKINMKHFVEETFCIRRNFVEETFCIRGHFVEETFCIRGHFLEETFCIRGHFMEETFCGETFCYCSN